MLLLTGKTFEYKNEKERLLCFYGIGKSECKIILLSRQIYFHIKKVYILELSPFCTP